VAGRQLTEPTPLEQALIGEIRAKGPMGFDQVVDRALYDPHHGFYARGGRAGRHGDFLTSPEVGPLFGAVVARALDRWWTELGSPDPFTVVEAGAGVGTLARAVLAAEPACSPALRYVLVERADALRARQGDHLDLVDDPEASAGPGSEASGAIGASGATGGPTSAPGAPTGRGPRVVSCARFPVGPLTGVVLANELLDNLAFGLVERGPSGWREVRVVVDEAGPGLVETSVAARPEVALWADRVVPDAAVGARIPDQLRARQWVADGLVSLERGWLVVLDYADTTAAMARRPQLEWLRTYRGHGRGGSPLHDIGYQDVTCEVAVDQLARIRPPERVETQADFLARHGLAELVDEGRQVWAQRAHIGDLEAIRARSRVGEAEALVDPTGLGGFTVLQWRQA
jgi:SAM-dependent MidA family methyltransferase